MREEHSHSWEGVEKEDNGRKAEDPGSWNLSKKTKDSSQSGRKYLQSTDLIKVQYPEYTKSTCNSTTEKTIQCKKGPNS